MKHDNPLALITGANQGIGLQIAKDLAAAGLTVLIGSRVFERGKAAAKSVEGGAHAIQLDVTDMTSIDAAAERIRKEFGRLDVLINNAAISNTSKRGGESVAEYARRTRPSNVPSDEMRAVWETNVSASSPYIRRCCRFCARRREPASSTFRVALAR
jgi:NAD(P)-dependent dehydrogenase (short-subunit alcohol dehydrogenase family)